MFWCHLLYGASTSCYEVGIVGSNSPPPAGLAGRRVYCLEIPRATSEEEEDPLRIAYRARLKGWTDTDAESGLKLRFQPIREHLEKLELLSQQEGGAEADVENHANLKRKKFELQEPNHC